MAISCPNKNLKAWKDLEKLHPDKAYLLWNEYDGNVPDVYYSKVDPSSTLKKAIGFKAKSNLSSFKNMTKKVNIFNNAFGTKHFAKRGSYIGESDSFFVTLIENWTGYHPKPNLTDTIRDNDTGYEEATPLLQLEKEKPLKQVNEELDLKLKQLLSNLGIGVEGYEKFKEKYGVDAVAVADIVNKIIYMNEGLASEDTLSEETGHFIIELLGDSPLANRLLSMMAANDYYKDVLGANYESYFEAYNGNIEMLVKEAAGQILGRAIVSNFNNEMLDIPARQLTMMERIWNYVKSIFSKVDSNKWRTDLIEIYGETASNFLKENLSGLNVDNLKKDIKLFSIPQSQVDKLKDVAEKVKTRSANRLEIYIRKDKTLLSDAEDKHLKKLTKDFNDKKYLGVAISGIEHARSIYGKIADSIEELKSDMQNLDTVNLQKIARRLRDMKSFNDSYMPMINEVTNELIDQLKDNPDNEEIKKTIEIASDLMRNANKLNQLFYEFSTPVFAKFLGQFIGNGPMKNLEAALKEAEGDITFWQRFLDSMAEAGDPILQLIDVAVKDSKQAAMQNSLVVRKALMQGRMDLEQSGIKDSEFLFERDSNGVLTGNIISKHNHGEYQKNKKEFFNKLNSDLGLPEDRDERREMLNKNKALSKKYNGLLKAWVKSNLKNKDNWFQILEEKKIKLGGNKPGGTAQWRRWLEDNIDTYDGEMTPRWFGDLMEPSDRYLNKEYKAIKESKEGDGTNYAKKQFLELIETTLENLNKMLPEQYSLKGTMLPQLRKDFVERIKDAASTGDIAQVKEEFADAFTNVEDDISLGNKRSNNGRDKLTDESGRPVNFLPIHFTRRLKNSKNMSTDIVSIMSAFSIMTNDYKEMSKIVDLLEVGRDVLDAREILATKGGTILEKTMNFNNEIIKQKIVKAKGKGYAIDRLNDFYKMVVYGESRSEGTDIKMPWGENVVLNSERMIDFLGKYTAINTLALNLYAGLQNPLIGNAMIRIEGFAKEHVSNGDLWEAEKLMASNLPSVIAQANSRNKNNYLDLWREKFDVQQNYGRDTHEIEMERKTMIGKLFKSSSLFFLNSIGEYYMQSKMSFALANKVELKDKDGNKITLNDAYEVKGNMLALKDGVTKPDGSAWTNADERKFIRKQNAINNSLHGIYNDIDRSTIQYYAVGRLATMFRKFMRPGLNRRFRKQKYNYEMDATTEGFYYTFFNFTKGLMQGIAKGQWILMSQWKDLSPNQRANMFRMFTELSYFVTAVVLAGIAEGLAGDEDDDDMAAWTLNMWAYQMSRLQTELSFWWDINQTLKILKSPAAGVDQLSRLYDLFSLILPWNLPYALEEIQRGRYKGVTRLQKAAQETIPLWDTVGDAFFPSDKLVYFRLNR
jgi:hypothetical protein